MKCPVCNAEMNQVGMARVAGTSIITTFECPSCHYRAEQPAKKQA